MYKLYHATNYDNFLSILNNGITSGTDGIVYLIPSRILPPLQVVR